MAERDRDQRRNRRRFARRQWARRWLTWRYLAGLLVTVLAVGFAVHAVYFSSWLAVEEAEVIGESQLREREILRAADVPVGEQLARVDTDSIEVRVRSLATVESADVSRQWPHGVRIEVVERTPIAVIARGSGGYTQIDAEGVTFGRVGQPPENLPQIRTGPGADKAALTEAAGVVSALSPEVSVLVGHVEVASIDEILLRLRDGRTVRWGSADSSSEKAQVLLAFFDAEEAGELDPARMYDVSVPGRPTTRR